MSKINISQIKNLPKASPRSFIIFDGSDNVWSNSANSSFVLPAGTSANRPSSPVRGEFRYNTGSNFLEFFNGSQWTAVPVSAGTNVNQTYILFSNNGGYAETITTTWTNIAVFATVSIIDSIYSVLSPYILQINSSGTYRIRYHGTAFHNVNTQTTSEWSLVIGGTVFQTSYSYGIHRGTPNSRDTASKEVIAQITGGQQVSLRARVYSGANLIATTYECTIIVEKIR
jgi:hypothetical protein